MLTVGMGGAVGLEVNWRGCRMQNISRIGPSIAVDGNYETCVNLCQMLVRIF